MWHLVTRLTYINSRMKWVRQQFQMAFVVGAHLLWLMIRMNILVIWKVRIENQILIIFLN